MHGRDDDASLVSACRQGDLRCFQTLVEKHGGKLYAVAYRITGDGAEAEEIVQEAFVNAWKGIRGFRGDASFSTWLTAIAVNLSRNRLRRMRTRKAREPLSMDEPPDSRGGRMARTIPSPDPTPHERLERDEELSALKSCVDSLEPVFKEAVVLRDMRGLSYAEIAAILHEPEGTIKSRLFRAREALRGCMRKAMGLLR